MISSAKEKDLWTKQAEECRLKYFREWENQGQNPQLRILYPAKVSFKEKGKIKHLNWASQCRLAKAVKKSESEVARSCRILCNPMNCSLSGSSVHGIFQARVLEWVAISFSRVIFPTQGLNPGLLHRRQMLYRLSHQGSPQISLQNSSLPGCGIHDAPHLNFPWNLMGFLTQWDKEVILQQSCQEAHGTLLPFWFLKPLSHTWGCKQLGF